MWYLCNEVMSLIDSRNQEVGNSKKWIELGNIRLVARKQMET